MSGRKLLLLLAILLLGGALEGAFTLRGQLVFGPQGCHLRGDAFDGPYFDYAEERRIETPSALALRVDNAFGRVQVTPGALGSVLVKLHKRVYTREEARAKGLAQRVELRTTLAGQALRVTTNRGELERELRDAGLATDVELQVPPDTLVTVVNEHGEVDVRGVQSGDLQTAFEGLKAEGIAGDLRLSVRHGQTHVDGVGGALTLQARHGDVSVQRVSALTADVEHGDLEVSEAGASDVQLKFGKATLQGLSGALQLTGQHAGVEASDVSGDASVESAYREVKLRNVRGNVRVKLQHGGLEVSDVSGTLSVESSYDDVDLARVAGRVALALEHGGLHAEDLTGGGVLKVSGDDVQLTGFKGPFEIEVKRAGASLEPAGPLSDSLRVETQNGDIRLLVPSGSRFDVEASARFGEVHAEDVDGLSTRSQSEERLSARVGAGGAAVRLDAEHGDVRLEGRGPAVRGE